MPRCGSQMPICDVPIRFDTYLGCSHGCKYCFVHRKSDIKKIKVFESAIALKNFIDGNRTKETKWCDFNIPLHWGGVSDPFQPIELKEKRSLSCLNVFQETNYPFIVSTKGKAIIEDEYLDLLSNCNCVVQVSIVSDKYDKLETGAPSFKERIKIIQVLVKKVQRVNVRVQPYMREVREDVLKTIDICADIGVYGVTFEGMKFIKKKRGLIRNGSDFVYPKKKLEYDFNILKDRCHVNDLKFYSGENRLRNMGDSLCCCGVDGLGFDVNIANLNHYIFDNKNFKYSSAMSLKGNTSGFKATFGQNTVCGKTLKQMSYKDVMEEVVNNKKIVRSFLGLDED